MHYCRHWRTNRMREEDDQCDGQPVLSKRYTHSIWTYNIITVVIIIGFIVIKRKTGDTITTCTKRKTIEDGDQEEPKRKRLYEQDTSVISKRYMCSILTFSIIVVITIVSGFIVIKRKVRDTMTACAKGKTREDNDQEEPKRKRLYEHDTYVPKRYVFFSMAIQWCCYFIVVEFLGIIFKRKVREEFEQDILEQQNTLDAFTSKKYVLTFKHSLLSTP